MPNAKTNAADRKRALREDMVSSRAENNGDGVATKASNVVRRQEIVARTTIVGNHPFVAGVMTPW